MVVFSNVKAERLKLLEETIKQAPKSPYELLRLKKGKVTLILFNSGKLLLQGETYLVAELAEELMFLGIGKLVQSQMFKPEEGLIIGSDECLKGDTFGGLIVAAVKADEKIREKLIGLGVADSKKLSDSEIVEIAKLIKEVASYEIKSLYPEHYNEDGNVTKMLNRLHNKCALKLLPGKHVVDKYPGCDVGDIVETKAESKYVEVAAASILARDESIRQLDELSRMAGFTLPRGSTHVKEALEKIKHKRLDFNQLVKTSFSNVKKYL